MNFSCVPLYVAEVYLIFLMHYILLKPDYVFQDVKENPVMIYMKGVPEMPRCGFSSLAVRVLKEYGNFLVLVDLLSFFLSKL